MISHHSLDIKFTASSKPIKTRRFSFKFDVKDPGVVEILVTTLENLKNTTSITLSLPNCCIVDTVLLSLGELKGLEEVTLEGLNPADGPRIFTMLENNKKIRILDLKFTQTEKICDFLHGNLEALTRLDITHINPIKQFFEVF